MYPLNRNRRLRSKQSLRNLIKESSIHPHDFIVPLFIIEGNNFAQADGELVYGDSFNFKISDKQFCFFK